MQKVVTGKTFFRFFLASIFLWSQATDAALTSLARNDPYPLFTTLDPHTFLYTHDRLLIKDPCLSEFKSESFGFSLSPFGQAADCGKDACGRIIELGDIACGHWSMISLLYGPLPDGQTLAPSLELALNELFPGIQAGTLNDPDQIDPDKLFGFFSAPLTYRKKGLRLELDTNFIGGFGVSLQAGFSSIRQVLNCNFVDLTCTTTCPSNAMDRTAATPSTNPCCTITLDPVKVEQYLMKDLKVIAKEINLNIAEFCETSIEEVRFNLFWRQAFELNADAPRPCWPHVLVYPFVEVGASISPGKDIPANVKFAAPFGNNGHTSVGISTGINFDFIETIEIGAEGGVTHFFSKDFCNFPMPTNACQCNIYPFQTNVSVHPGLNWYFGAKLSAYHFLDCLSMHFQYIMVEHKEDCIRLETPDDAFLPEVLEHESCWKTKLANIGFNYDISPNMGLGLLWQAPLSQRGTYRSTTIMASLYATF